jgi:tyrosine decarboxylase / aspartate 1-decarboxylase
LAASVQEKGWSRRRVQATLRRARGRDFSYAAGEILGSMCTEPHPLAHAAHARFAATNLGDPDHFPGTKQLEQEVLEDTRVLLHGPQRAAARFLTGGTEANLFALYVAREKTGKRRVVVPAHAHFSFEKAARLLGMQLAWVPTGPDGRSDVAAMTAALDADTALVVAVAGSTELGLVDDVPALARAAKRAGVLLHVDAAFGGYLLPFLDDAPRFDFRLPGVWSIALDPHKGGMATIPAGLLVLRDGRDWDHVAVETPYVSTDRQSQLLGTRPGSAAAATWAVHRALGQDGFRRIVHDCMENARYLAAGLDRLHIPLVAPPELTVVTFRVPAPTQVQKALEEKGIRVNVVPRLDALRVVVNPHVDRKAIRRLLRALEEIL